LHLRLISVRSYAQVGSAVRALLCERRARDRGAGARLGGVPSAQDEGETPDNLEGRFEAPRFNSRDGFATGYHHTETGILYLPDA